jgi:hypothetical protein
MDGWRWAGVDEVNGLFNVYLQNAGVAPGNLLVGPDQYQEGGVHTWGPAFLADFHSTFTLIGVFVAGLTSSPATPADAYLAYISDTITPFPNCCDGQEAISNITFGRNVPTDPSVGMPGGWFYRAAPSVVPGPSTLLLLSLSLPGLRVFRRRALCRRAFRS